MAILRKDLCADALVSGIRSNFTKVEDKRLVSTISLSDIFMSGYALFSLKYPSLLSFDRDFRSGDSISGNMRSLFGVEKVPSDTCMREVLDEIDPDAFRPAFKDLFTRLQRGKELEKYQFLDGKYLISIDGTGLFSSNEVHCASCMVKVSKESGKKTYYHQCLGVVMVHPGLKTVVPFYPEAITVQDGKSKNDCERNACKRVLEKLRKDHPRLNAIILEDGLGSSAPNIKTILDHGFSFILGAKPGDHKYLFEQVDLAGASTCFHDLEDESGLIHKFKWVNSLSINASNEEVKVNFLEYEEFSKKTGKVQRFTWVTDLEISRGNVFEIMKGGRARWKIENETFNTLKNQGYNFEHNFGHGKKNLCTNFANLMFLAFAVDQIQQLSCKVFQQVRQKCGTFKSYCDKLIAAFFTFEIPDWLTLLTYLATRQLIPIPTSTSPP